MNTALPSSLTMQTLQLPQNIRPPRHHRHTHHPASPQIFQIRTSSIRKRKKNIPPTPTQLPSYLALVRLQMDQKQRNTFFFLFWQGKHKPERSKQCQTLRAQMLVWRFFHHHQHYHLLRTSSRRDRSQDTQWCMPKLIKRGLSVFKISMIHWI